MEGERLQERNRHGADDGGSVDGQRCHPLIWQDHDVLPGEGRWLYVVDRVAWDAGRDEGVWVSAELDPHQAVLLLGPLLGRGVNRDELSVVDQLGIEEPVDEDYFTPEPRR